MKKDILLLEKITKEKAGNKMLNQFFLEILDGEIVNLIGLEGSGKEEVYSTLFGQNDMDSGEIWFAGRKYSGEKELPVEKVNGIFFIENKKLIIPDLSVAENLYIIEKVNYFQLSVSRRKMEQQAKVLFNRFGINIAPEQQAKELNSFECCVLRLMRAYIKRAKLVVVNDILDDYSVERIDQLIDILNRFKQEGISILWFNSYPDYITEIADRVVGIRQGRNSMMFYKEEYEKQKVLSCLVGKDNLVTEDWMSGTDDEIIFQAEHIKNEYFNDLSIFSKRGEIVGIYDLQNKFSRELRRLLMGKRNYTGRLYVEGKVFQSDSEYKLIRNKIGVIDGEKYQDLIFPDFSVEENIELAAYKKATVCGYFINRRVKRYLDKSVGELCKKDGCDKSVSNISRRNAMQIVYNRWRLAGIKVLLCFQPFLRLDAISRKQLETILLEFKHRGIGIVLSSANISDLLPLCDRILLIKENQIASEVVRKDFQEYF